MKRDSIACSSPWEAETGGAGLMRSAVELRPPVSCVVTDSSITCKLRPLTHRISVR
jgi:hypothetical protein